MGRVDREWSRPSHCPAARLSSTIAYKKGSELARPACFLLLCILLSHSEVAGAEIFFGAILNICDVLYNARLGALSRLGKGETGGVSGCLDGMGCRRVDGCGQG
jgi:hypothetical protein